VCPHGLHPVPAEPATVGAYLASLKDTHAPATIRRRLAAIGKMHRFNGLPWSPSHRDMQEPLKGLLRDKGRPARKAAALTLPMLRRLVATCDASARGRRDRALLLIGFAGALRRSELVALRVEDVSVVAGGLRLRIARSKTDPAGAGAEIGLPRGKHPDTCPVQAFKAWRPPRRGPPNSAEETPPFNSETHRQTGVELASAIRSGNRRMPPRTDHTEFAEVTAECIDQLPHRRSRVRCNITIDCCSALLIGMKRMVNTKHYIQADVR
jgi:integrase